MERKKLSQLRFLGIPFLVTSKCSRRAPIGPGSGFQAAYWYLSYPRASLIATATGRN